MDQKDTLAAASAAVTGPDTPDAIVSTSKPTTLLTLAMACAGPVITLVLAGTIYLLGRPTDQLTLALARVDALKTVGMGLIICLVITILRLASGEFRSGRVQAGPASMDFDTR